MKIQRGNGWSCLPCAFATILDMPVENFIEMIGHDGSAEPYEDMPGQKAGFHEQECIEVVQQLGYACTPIEIVPQMMATEGGPVRRIWFLPELLTTANPLDWNLQRFRCHLKGTRGVITGAKTIHNGRLIGHAVAWDRVIYDSQGEGFVYTLNDAPNHNFVPRTYWKIQEVTDGRTAENGSFNTCAEKTEEVSSSID